MKAGWKVLPADSIWNLPCDRGAESEFDSPKSSTKRPDPFVFVCFQYDEEAVAVLKFIRRAKELGFTLKEIKSLLNLRLDTSATRADVREQAREKVADIEAKIADLHRIKGSLVKLIRKCSGHGATKGCPILDALQGSGDEETQH